MKGIKMKNITIYSTQECVKCKKFKDFFKEHKINFTERDVGSDINAASVMVEKSGQMSVPVIEINDEIIVDFDETKLRGLLNI